ncbi:trypsin-like peptidase domain-containing protein [Algoriphagus antarcticus]|uniref:Do/DeqQ family serine protease n=1 Tax=Algoriphagus antarcticus TaxID=238540 RepID=A0A3E0D6I3_9BACT|nr:trypsin-like peptidase domain-containing protein [Algoriphagus antarcticus]REG77612.1 Do/DeqQ family serine protease [Algoriphagus antarcticus]
MNKLYTIVLSVLLIIPQGVAIGRTNVQGTTYVRNAGDTLASSTENTVVTNSSNGYVDFVTAAKMVMPAVVHIKIQFNASSEYGASGSGVIISSDGLIATNNHVVENASAIDVTLPDKRTFSAKLIGRDPNTDLALLKIEAKDLPIVQFGNSDKVQIGEWVLAVGFPLSLNTTVTAGIVSAKARSIGIINRPGSNSSQNNATPQGNMAVESFIQTDAAINSGNSGGALVNTSGELIGINSAIASQTGSYAGYAFAIPVNLAKKILDDLKNFGEVKRGVLGVIFPSPAAEDQYLTQQGLNPASVKGVYITGVQNESAAAAAGLKEGDIIQSIDGIPLNSSTEFSERIARQKPGDSIKLTYLRNGTIGTVSATLKSEDVAKSENTEAKSGRALEEIYKRLGATFAPLTDEVKQRFNLNAGVLVTKVLRDGFFDQAGIPPGTIIVFINGKPINNPVNIDSALLSAQSGLIQILAIAPDGSKVVFDFSIGT